jgi:hypothetical protein
METRSRFNDGGGCSDGGIGEKVEEAKEKVRTMGMQLKELQEYVGHYLAAKSDALKLSVRNVVLYAALGILGLFAAIAFAATAVVLLCIGIAHGLGVLFGERYWLGDIVLAVVFLGAMALGVKIAIDKVMKTSKATTVGKYEQRERAQRQQFGHDVHERAKQAGPASGNQSAGGNAGGAEAAAKATAANASGGES